MEPGDILPLSTELMLVGWSVVLLVVHIFTQGALATREVGLGYNASPRDEGLKPAGVTAGRAERALRNFLETYPAFIGLALALALNAETGWWGTAGAWIWFTARVLYLPLYLLGVPYVRSFAWLASIAGLLVMTVALLV